MELVLRFDLWKLANGDPLAYFEMIKQEVPSLMINAWYLDDCVLVGKMAEPKTELDNLLREGPARGLSLSITKSNVWCPSRHI